MSNRTFITKSPEETVQVGEKLGKVLKGGDTVCLTGDLGGGKSHFTKGIAAGLGITEEIVSPTFVLMRVYERDNLAKLYHLDLYRIKGAEELEPMDLDDIIGDEKAIVVIEWPENAKEIVPNDAVWVKFKYLSDDSRELEISGREIK